MATPVALPESPGPAPTAAAAAEYARSHTPRLRGLTWLVWRQNRTLFWIGLAAALAVAAYAAVRHQQAVAAIDRQQLDACRGKARTSQDCFKEILRFGAGHQRPMRFPLRVMAALPLVFGLFLGSPQLAQELESGTYRTVCSQSVSRMRWVAGKLAVPLVLTVAISGTLALAMTWWWHPVADVMGGQFPWYGWYPFNGVGPVIVGQSVLMPLVGFTGGLLLRRTVAAMGTTLAVGALVPLGLDRIRRHLLLTVTVSAQHTTAIPGPADAWVVADGPLSPSGARVSDMPSCYSARDYDGCMAEHGRSGHWAEVHPASHLWPLQWAETGLCLLLACALAVLCVSRVRRRLA
ncbi:ABC transporter permease [Streptomyces caeni]|uniref:ABC transporter permease n=1 Tax=Streptomyces caeni TaxID=2307231 RepID=A0ABW4IKJ6_9ACTN